MPWIKHFNPAIQKVLVFSWTNIDRYTHPSAAHIYTNIPYAPAKSKFLPLLKFNLLFWYLLPFLHSMNIPWHFFLKNSHSSFKFTHHLLMETFSVSPNYWHFLHGEPIIACSYLSSGSLNIVYMSSACREESCFVILILGGLSF